MYKPLFKKECPYFVHFCANFGPGGVSCRYFYRLRVSFDVPGVAVCTTMDQFDNVKNLSAAFAMKESSEEDKGIMLCFKLLPLDYAKLTFTIMKVPRFEFLGGARFLAFVGWCWSCRNSRQPPCSDHHKVSFLF